jgi:hypothetical protein
VTPKLLLLLLLPFLPFQASCVTFQTCMTPPSTQASDASPSGGSDSQTAAAAAAVPVVPGFLRHFSDLDDAAKYAGIDFFMQFNQPPTNDTFCRAARFEGFRLHTGAPWEKVTKDNGQVRHHCSAY